MRKEDIQLSGFLPLQLSNPEFLRCIVFPPCDLVGMGQVWEAGPGSRLQIAGFITSFQRVMPTDVSES